MPAIDLGDPLPILPNRVSRFYRGGSLLHRFHGQPGRDGDLPEDWVGSTTAAYDPRGERPGEGLGSVLVAGRAMRLADVLGQEPAGLVGRDVIERAGPTTGVLVKLLDTAVRLPVHGHPTRAFAREVLGSAFGKAECWTVLATRPGGESPHVLIGFRRDVGRDELLDWIARPDPASLLASMNRLEVAAGDVFFVPPGTPHAIGAGIFMVEVQEPTDLSIVLERTGFPILEADARLDVPWETMVDAFDRRAMTGDDLLALRRQPIVQRSDPRGEAVDLLGDVADSFFRVQRVDVRGGWTIEAGGFAVLIVTAGRGRIQGRTRSEALSAGQAFAIPAAAGEVTVEPDGPMGLIVARPPRTERLPAISSEPADHDRGRRPSGS